MCKYAFFIYTMYSDYQKYSVSNTACQLQYTNAIPPLYTDTSNKSVSIK